MVSNACSRASLALSAALVCSSAAPWVAPHPTPGSNTCEAVANYNGPGVDPLWTLVCIDPCTQGCEQTDPVEIYSGFWATTCVCYGGSVDPDRTCCSLFLVEGPSGILQPAGIGACSTGSCESGDYCALFSYDPDTVGAKCYFD